MSEPPIDIASPISNSHLRSLLLGMRMTRLNIRNVISIKTSRERMLTNNAKVEPQVGNRIGLGYRIDDDTDCGMLHLIMIWRESVCRFERLLGLTSLETENFRACYTVASRSPHQSRKVHALN